MVDVDDASGSQREVDMQWRLLEEADIPERDRDAIERFVRHRKIHGTERSGTYSQTSETADLNKLRLSSERATLPLLDMGIDDVNTLIEHLTAEAPPKDSEGRTWRHRSYDGIEPGTNGYGYGIGRGIDGYTRALRVFFRWLHRHDEHGDYGFWQQIKTGNVDFPEPSERQFPDEDDYAAMRQAARGDPRAQAILAFYWESAVRRTLGAQLRLKHVDLDGGGRATFQPNPNGERQKDVEIKDYPLYNGIATLRVWINNHHPDPDNPDAPLFTVDTYDPDKPHVPPNDEDDGALSANRIHDILKELGREAGVEAETKTHSFRHAAVGRWKARGYSLAQVQRRTAWSDRSAAEMWGRYGDPDDEKIDAEIDELEGREREGGLVVEDPEPPERFDCGSCGATDIGSDHCPECGAPVSDEARQRDIDELPDIEHADDLLVRAIAQLEGEEAVELVDLRDRLSDEPGLAPQVIDRLEPLLGDD